MKITNATSQDKSLRNVGGIEHDNKVMHLSAIAYNLKKYLKFDQKRVESGVGSAALSTWAKSALESSFGASVKHPKLALPF